MAAPTLAQGQKPRNGGARRSAAVQVRGASVRAMTNTLPRIRWAIALSLAIVAILIVPARADAAACRPPVGVGHLTYEIRWLDVVIGRVAVRLRRDGDSLEVNNSVEVDAGVLLIDLLRFTHSSQERWRGGRLQRFDAHTVDNGRERRVHVVAADDGLWVDGKGGPYRVPFGTPLLTPWCPAALGGGQAIDPTKGRLTRMVATSLGEQSITIAGREYRARGYRLRGDLFGEAWFDGRGVLLLARVPAKGGTVATVVLSRVKPE
jgi:hypothetical protein